jgi:hypothetical protein
MRNRERQRQKKREKETEREREKEHESDKDISSGRVGRDSLGCIGSRPTAHVY